MGGSAARNGLSALRQRLRRLFFLGYGMRGTAPIDPAFGAGVGTPIDRFYLDRFFGAHRAAIAGSVLEIGDRTYTERFGSGVTRADVLSVADDEGVTYRTDLTSAAEVPGDTYDCVILPQALHFIYDMETALAEVHRMLAPGGRVLCTVPGISQVSRFDMDRWGDRWRLTSLSAAELFATAFDAHDIAVETYGNALAAVCFLQGVPAERVKSAKLDILEPDYQLIVGVSATKRAR